MADKKREAVYQIQVTLREVKPGVWRRIQVWRGINFGKLHGVLQIAVGWQDCHLHEFVIGRRRYGPLDPDDEYGREVIDERQALLSDVAPDVGASFEYLYDLGDGWPHELLLEAILMPEAAGRYPVCVAGEGSAPPEDVGGPSGYQQYLNGPDNPVRDELSLDKVNRLA